MGSAAARRHDAAFAMLRILLIEDDPFCSELVRAHLGTALLQCVSSLREGLACLAAEPFDVVITDLGLPDSAGLATLDAVRAATAHPIIVLSGNEAVRAAALARGAYAFLPKDRMPAEALSSLISAAADGASGNALPASRYQ
jgi:DNA-binding NarL/FixJ family response regulator